MDIIANILSMAGLKKRLLGQLSFYEPVLVQFPCTKSIGFHVVTQGEAYLHAPKLKQSLQLQKGDVAFMTRGCDHQISTEQKPSKNLPNPFATDFKPLHKGPASRARQNPKLTLVSGAFQFWNDPVHPFFHELPDWYIIRSSEIASYESLQTAINLLAQETSEKGAGSELVVQSLLDIIFTFILRKILQKNANKESTFSHALQDHELSKAIELMHSQCGKDWSLEDLASAAGLSRAGFAQKFKRSMGETPIQYLTTIRIQAAMKLLSGTDDKIESVAQAVGYQDAFSFSKAFKKLTGTPPRDFRNSDRATRNLAWRF